MRHPIAVALNIGLGIASFTAVSTVNAESLQEPTANDVEEVYVTGSRLPTGSETTIQFEIDGGDILRQGYVRTEDLLSDLPQVYTIQNSNSSNGATGTATISLRDLGPERSLVLLNGKRLPYGSPLIGGIGTDINQIPAALIDTMDLVTGGLSAIYGSDAVAGTLNIKLIDNFEGVQLNTQWAAYRHRNDNKDIAGYLNDSGFQQPKDTSWDGHTNATSLLLGTNFFDGRGNITAFASYRDINAVTQGARDYSACALDFDYNSCAGSYTIPEVRLDNFTSEDPSEHFDYRVQGNEFVDAEGLLYNYSELNYFQRPDRQWNTALLGHFDISDDLTLYAEFMGSNNHSTAQIAPSGNFFFTDSIACDHPFLSDQQFQTLCGQYGLTTDDVQTAFMGARNLAGGPRTDSIENSSRRYVIGGRGTVAGFLNYDIGYQYSRVSMRSRLTNDMSINNIFNALDAVEDNEGNIVCRSTLSDANNGCVPWNVFTEGAVTQEQLDYLSLDIVTRGYTEQSATTGFFDFNTEHFGFSFPMANSGIHIGAGFEFRQDELASRLVSDVDRFDVAGAPLPSDVKGGIRSKEYFVETHIPLIQNHEHAQNLAIEGSWRNAEYSTGINAESYGMGITWSPNNFAAVNAAFQQATRAPNVRELFEPMSYGLGVIGTDPCSGPLDDDGLTQAGFDLASCAYTGVTTEQFGTIPDTFDGFINLVHGGNVALEAETAKTYTVGLTLTPMSVKGLTLSFEHFNIEVDNAIGQFDPIDAVYGCLFSGDSTFCDRISRGVELGDLWRDGSVLSLNENLSKETRQGFDAHITYQAEFDGFNLSITNNYSRINSATYQLFEGSDVIECAGIWGGSCNTVLPKQRNNLRIIASQTEGNEVSIQLRTVGKVDAIDPSWGQNLKRVSYIDIHGKYALNEHIVFNAGVNNVTDKAPPLAGQWADPSNAGAGNTFPTLYDVLGQYLYSGVTVSF